MTRRQGVGCHQPVHLHPLTTLQAAVEGGALVVLSVTHVSVVSVFVIPLASFVTVVICSTQGPFCEQLLAAVGGDCS